MSQSDRCPACGQRLKNTLQAGNSGGIGRRQRELLKLLRREGPQTVAEIVDALGQTSGAVQVRTKHLMIRKLVERKPHPMLAFRGYVYFLTEIGQEAINRKSTGRQ